VSDCVRPCVRRRHVSRRKTELRGSGTKVPRSPCTTRLRRRLGADLLTVNGPAASLSRRRALSFVGLEALDTESRPVPPALRSPRSRSAVEVDASPGLREPGLLFRVLHGWVPRTRRGPSGPPCSTAESQPTASDAEPDGAIPTFLIAPTRAAARRDRGAWPPSLHFVGEVGLLLGVAGFAVLVVLLRLVVLVAPTPRQGSRPPVTEWSQAAAIRNTMKYTKMRNIIPAAVLPTGPEPTLSVTGSSTWFG
jgi:hypothetical protein